MSHWIGRTMSVLSAVTLLVLTACDDEKPEPVDSVSLVGAIPAYAQRDGDAARGRHALITEPYVSCGLPYRVYQALAEDVSVTPVSGREGTAAALPYFSTLFTDDSGEEIVATNCLACHATSLFGELTLGLGNEFLDFTENPSIAVERAGALVRGEAETRIWARYADRIHAIAPYMTMHTVGVNPANNLTFALISHRDPESNAWSATPLLPSPATDPPPISVPPWWRMRKKHAMFSLSEGRGDHARFMMAVSLLCSDSFDELRKIDSYAPDIRAFITSLTPPDYPFAIDDVKAAAGESIFESHCAACHGTYGDEPNYPNQLVALDVVGTDPLLAEYVLSDGQPYTDWFNRSFYGELAFAAPGRGYVAPPLDGVWSTAPFLHNGSVPTIRSLLDSASRPAYWRHVATDANDPDNYNDVDLGWRIEKLERGKSPDSSHAENKHIYDTTLPGYANTGHAFGDALTNTRCVPPRFAE